MAATESEIWVDVIGHPNYAVSNLGRVILKSTGQFIRPMLMKVGYLSIRLDKQAYYLHRIVLESFVPNTQNLKHVNHINGIKTDNRLENLEWSTPGHNQIHAMRTSLRKSIDGCCKGLRPIVAVNLDTGLEIWFDSAGSCGRFFNISYKTIHKIAQNVTPGNKYKPWTFWFADNLPWYDSEYNSGGVKPLSEFVCSDATMQEVMQIIEK